MDYQHTKISDLKEGQTVNGYYIINSIRPGVTKYGSAFFRAELEDASGTISGVCWEADENTTNAQNGMIVFVIGKTNTYNDILQLCIESFEPVEPTCLNEDILSALIPVAPINVDAYSSYVINLMDSIKDADIGAICHYLIAVCYWDQFINYPAAKSVHHAFLHGLLMHTVDMAYLAETIADTNVNLNRDLLIGGVLLHDIGKLTEFETSPVTGLVTGYTERGNLVGHSVLGAEDVRYAAEVTRARPEVTMLLQHMILSHHGDPSAGAAKVPMTIEAELLHDLDLLDSRKQIFAENLALMTPGEYSANVYALSRRIYHHGLTTRPDKDEGV